MKKISCWLLLGYRPHATQPGIYWTISKYFSNIIKDNDKYILNNNIIYKEDYDNYDDINNPIYLSYNAKEEERLMMIIKNTTDEHSAEIFRLEQNKLEENKNTMYLQSLNIDNLDIC